jgi:hypothetical protein
MSLTLSNLSMQVEIQNKGLKLSGLSLQVEIQNKGFSLSNLSLQIEINTEIITTGESGYLDLNYTKLVKGTNIVAEIKDLQGLTLSGNAIDVTTLFDTDSNRKFIPGEIEVNEVIASGFFTINDLKGQSNLFDAFENHLLDCYTIEFGNNAGGTWLFFARVSSYGTGVKLNDAVQWFLSLKLTGKTYLGAEASAGIDDVSIVRGSDLGMLTSRSYYPAFNPNYRYYKVTFSDESVKILLSTTYAHYAVWYIDDIYQGLFDFTTYSDAIYFSSNEVKKISFKMWQDDKSPLYYDYILGRLL